MYNILFFTFYKSTRCVLVSATIPMIPWIPKENLLTSPEGQKEHR